jgi:ATP-dependent DNA helicase RecG
MRLSTQRDTYLKSLQKLTLPVSTLKGVGPQRALCFARKGIRTILDLLFFTPIRYEDRTKIIPIQDSPERTPVQVQGKVLFAKEERFFRNKKRIYRIMIQDEGAGVELVWFNYRKPHLDTLAIKGSSLLAYGSVDRNRGRRQMVHLEVTNRLRKRLTNGLVSIPCTPLWMACPPRWCVPHDERPSDHLSSIIDPFQHLWPKPSTFPL